MLSPEPAMPTCNPVTGYVHSVESFGLVDGPGVRYVVFLAGCAMRCAYCHNPDTWDRGQGKIMTVDEVLAKALRCKSYWGSTGGITVSGGEAMLQMPFVTDLFAKCHAEGVNTTLDTSGQPFTFAEPRFSEIKAMLDVTDLVMLDIKHIDDEVHKKLTGHSNKNILEFARYLSDNGKNMWIRHVLVPGVTDDDAALGRLREFVDSLKTVTRREILPYHDLGVHKWKQLGYEYSLDGVLPPSKERVENAQRILGC